MTRTPPARRLGRRFPLPPDIDLDEDRWRQLHDLAADDRRDLARYVQVVVERHIDREWSRLARKLAVVEPAV